MPKINAGRLLSELRRFAQFGAYRTGVHRPSYSKEDMDSRRWLAQQYEAVGLQAHIDGVGNVLGMPRSQRQSLLIGSHLESQNYAGWLDGALGVIYGLEIARTFAETTDCAGLLIAPVAWADEEGHYLSMLGSRSFVGDIDEAEIDLAVNVDHGLPLRDALRAAGLAGVPRSLLEPGRHVGYLEAHIEQGDALEASSKRIGVVTSIVGIWQYSIVFHGIQNHAGTTRMAIRKDAGVAAAMLAMAIAKRFPEVAGPRSVWTTGRITMEPGAPSIIPGKAEMLFQFRDSEMPRLESLDAVLMELIQGVATKTGCRADIERTEAGEPSQMDPAFQVAIENAAARHAPGASVRMPSGAGHDAQVVARKLRAAMLFVPSIGGISHHWTENSDDADLVLGCQVLADAAETILRREGGEM
ncbi:MAG: hydantoinase/carbamoylase family amidase [Mesorhizobium sp.]|uniref:hydantoinase/carbamoylase family amidase n=1 Tax=Mesorhizobium sp. TaxID=1871066 RepID=UPI000FE627E6|nr:hydantoinase/carbamoylase family amidase [Mesorhizobium sp.]RWB36205.1 MAG: hydantoinase/carbamoylase family amidase [Mesorhizobium sp.]RWC40710.1 MAG: hydantoinase/carbamoylase family amidase [Mesorhizobium sp.]RWF79665.1 MAG: hydantoinase/carbamoylase family amidase [Mesorhizobium sp.]